MDYRPVDCSQTHSRDPVCEATDGGMVLPQPTAGIRYEGAGTAVLEGVEVSYRLPAGGQRPEWWARTCTTNPALNKSVDPSPQHFSVAGAVARCSLAL